MEKARRTVFYRKLIDYCFVDRVRKPNNRGLSLNQLRGNSVKSSPD
jgi:hypothetical protein